jgi:glutamate/tyrosine decarboxylase-like PLP-dependent enzyme
VHNPARDLLLLADEERAEVWAALIRSIESYLSSVDDLPVATAVEPLLVREALSNLDLSRGIGASEALEFAVRGLTDWQLHTPHPRYFGLFNPASSTMGVVADALVAAWNPQLAAWSHSQFPYEVERFCIGEFGAKLGLPQPVDGTFCSGGAEANHTALLLALSERFPSFRAGGIRSLEGQPALYVSEQAHHSSIKAARACGLGDDAVRIVPVDDDLRISLGALEERLEADLAAGLLPFLLVGTAGGTSAGSIDPLPELAEVASRHGIWFHVDGAWGAAAALVPELSHLLKGIHAADSVTFDAHKFLSVPMGAGMLLTSHDGALGRAFGVDTAYMPHRGDDPSLRDPYTHSLQWSRRHIGLKVFLTLATLGWDGYAEALRWQVRMGRLLRAKLLRAEWEVMNSTELPIVCFRPEGEGIDVQGLADRVVQSGQAWISATRLHGGAPALRACVTSYRTGEADLDELILILETARAEARKSVVRTEMRRPHP